MRILITGAAGFIGSHVADAAVEAGHEVVLADAMLPTAHRGATPPTGVTRCDVRDPRQLRPLLAGVDVVCHQAAMVGHGVSAADAPLYASHNDFATAVLLAEMYSAGVSRLVLASSMVVYGEGRYRCQDHGVVRAAARSTVDLAAGRYDPLCPHCGAQLAWGVVPEDAPLDPRSTYAATKVASEHLSSAWARQTDSAVVALRYHNVYGPRMPRDTPYAGVASIFRSAVADGRAPQVMEDGGQLRDFVHVKDIARANLAAAELSLAPGRFEAVNVCSGTPHSIGDLAAALGGPTPEIVGGARAGDVRHIVADPAKALRLLGFRAHVDFAAGMREFSAAPLRSLQYG